MRTPARTRADKIQPCDVRRDPGVCALEKKICDFLVKVPLDFGGTLILPAPHKICDESVKGMKSPSLLLREFGGFLSH